MESVDRMLRALVRVKGKARRERRERRERRL
jgi:hypothetical protein